MNPKQKLIAVWLFIIFFAAYTAYLAYNGDEIATSIKASGDTATGLFWYYISQPAYLFIVAGVVYFNRPNSLQAIKSFFAGILLVLAFDFVSFPHCVSQLSLPTDANSYLCSDTIMVKSLSSLGLSTAWLLQYVLLPILFVLIALALLGHIEFFSKIKNMARQGD